MFVKKGMISVHFLESVHFLDYLFCICSNFILPRLKLSRSKEIAIYPFIYFLRVFVEQKATERERGLEGVRVWSV